MSDQTTSSPRERLIRAMAGNGGFQPLSDADFAVMEDRGKVTFPPAVRARLNEGLSVLCGVEGDRHIHEERKAAAVALSGLARDADRVLAALRTLNRFAVWKLFPSGTSRYGPGLSAAGEALAQPFPADAVITVLGTLQVQAKRVARDLKPPPGQKGAPRNVWFESFIILVAGAFETAGGNPSAARQGLPGEDEKRRRETPFLRVLRYVNGCLPSPRRARSAKALDERAARVLDILKKRAGNRSPRKNA